MISIKGRSVVLFGGSGFLASALIPRLQSAGAASILCVARNEGNLIKTQQQHGVDILSGDIADPCLVSRAIDGQRIVMNLAAFKHVGLAETTSFQCVRSNVLGLITLLTEIASPMSDIPEAFLFVSTDKAAAPVKGVYGATKFLGERLVQEAATSNRETQYRIVRYGNILYSTGSVLCKWKDALERGMPITITDPDATRFYWTGDQAVDLIFDCFANALTATPHIGKMKSIRMGDLLLAMITKYGGGRQAKVNHIGLQPGESKHEILVESGQSSQETERYTPEEIEGLI
jgi:UDP-N-acetylglucosamine 4,6-dehydratase/5-epimerase